MADPRFFKRLGPFTVADLARLTGAAIGAGGDPGRVVTDVATLSEAGPEQISFLDNRKYADQFRATKAGVCLVSPDMAGEAPAGTIPLIAADPYRAYAIVAAAFYPRPKSAAGIHPSAIVDPTAVLGEGVSVAAGAVIGAGVEIGAGTAIGPNAVIGDGVIFGPGGSVGASASISHAIIGAMVHVYPGCRIGQDGFGFAMGPKGHLKVPQLGRVTIGDDVEIGANTTIDRGSGPDTVIGPGCRIDNLVQIGHNVVLGPGCIIVSQVGISGSTQLGAGVVMGGQAGAAGHIKIGAGARVAAQTGIMADIPAGSTVMGLPATPIKQFWREVATVKALAKRPAKADKTKTDDNG